MEETLDTLSIGNLQILQAAKGYRYSLDPVLLAGFVTSRNPVRVVDLGTGSAILLLLLARKSPARELIGIELQAALADRARRNVMLNRLQDRVRVLHADVRAVRSLLPAGCADLVVSNPPFRSLASGRVAPDDERAAARHEVFGGLSDFCTAASWLLNDGGSFAVVQLAERLPELLSIMMAMKIEPKRLRLVHPHADDAARLVLVEGRKGGRPGLRVESPLVIYRGRGEERNYSEEILALYAGGVFSQD